ncbi:precorrin-8X methylmutase [Oscillatoria sp. CS-180]|uniref:precorrin-8X methylmutase n=1 Tax=Oscillatoria sp. CS-180 TaxID=3021720 RepID=UPI00232E1C1A|nr:precorrin-8X methylmutase [Oscillatoria sp. CS-180]MDB9529137.1 precorrin-8X methylmutase [Oscillatoria sp. CS-180]
MPLVLEHPILRQSFTIIDQEIGQHGFSQEEYAILRRVIHSTADFEFVRLLSISPNAVHCGKRALLAGCPIVVDVGMVRQGCQGMVQRTSKNRLVTAVEMAEKAEPGRTRTETGLLQAYEQFPDALYVIGNAPTALKALCDRVAVSNAKPALIIGVPVGFVGVLEAKQQLATLAVPQIRTAGRKGGSSVAAAILNALLVLAWEAQS